MLISTKGRYALRILTDMAERENGEFQPLSELARKQGISEKYLEGIMHTLVQNGVLEGSRGRTGGYRFRKPPQEVTIWEVLEPTDGNLTAVSCQKKDAVPCERIGECRSVPLWQGLDEVIHSYLSGYTVMDLLRSERSAQS